VLPRLKPVCSDKAVGHVCALFYEDECCNVFKAAGYEAK
jgi:hypothetical protein